MLCGILQREQPFRKQLRPDVDLVLLPDEDGEEWILHEIRQERGQRSYVAQEARLNRSEIVCSGPVLPWVHVEYMDALMELAEQMDMDL